MSAWKTVILPKKVGFSQIIKSLLNLHTQTFELPPSHSSCLYLIYSLFKMFLCLKSLFWQLSFVFPVWVRCSPLCCTFLGSVRSGREAALWIKAHNWNLTYQIGGNLQSSLLPWGTGLFSSGSLLKHLLHKRLWWGGQQCNPWTPGPLHLMTPGHPKFNLSKITILERAWFLESDKLGFSSALHLLYGYWVSYLKSLNLCFFNWEAKDFGIGECSGLVSVLEISLLQLCGGWAGGEKPEAVQRLNRKKCFQLPPPGRASTTYSPLWP